ncbi:MAG: type I methionyl aminopeptidase [Acidobacteriota bacterium]
MIICKSPAELIIMDRCNKIVRKILRELGEMIRPGLTTKEIDRYAEERARQEGAVAAFKGYRGFPASICTSVNNQIVHGIPSERCSLKEGDIISLDFGILMDGFYGDAAITYPVGRISETAKKLIEVTKGALMTGIEHAKSGERISDISHAIQCYAQARGFSVVKEFVGHGIGSALHEDPQIPNYGEPGRGPEISNGMVLAIEPMINAGTDEVLIENDGWTAVTKDGELSAHFELSVGIKNGRPWILGEE